MHDPTMQPQGQPAQPQASGQGGATGFNWGLFPNVPEDQRAMLEPHLREVQGHVTKLEQQLAPFKALLDAGMTAEAATGLVNFARRYEQEPLAVWEDMGRQLQQSGHIDSEADVEAIIAAANGDFAEEPVVPEDPNQPPDEMPEWARQMQEKLNSFEERDSQKAQQEATRRQQQLFQASVQKMKAELKEAGYPDEIINAEGFMDEIAGRLVATRGDVDRAVQGIISHRDGVVQHFTQKNTNDPQSRERPLEVNSVPRPPRQPTKKTDPWSKAREAATQSLAMDNEAAAAEGAPGQ
jgi:hypothetical protein